MGILSFGGFERGGTAGVQSAAGTYAYVSTGQRSGDYCVRMNVSTGSTGQLGTYGKRNANGEWGYPFTESHLFWSFAFRPTTVPSSTYELFCRGYNITGLTYIGVVIKNTRKIQFYASNGGGLIGSESDFTLSDAWYIIELELQSGTSQTQTVSVYNEDGTLVGSISATASPAQNDRLQFGKAVSINNKAVDYYFDDWCVADDAFCPRGMRVGKLDVTGDGSEQDFIEGTNASDYTQVDEVPWVDADYVQSPTTGNPNVALFAFEAATGLIVGPVVGMLTMVRCRENVAATTAFTPRLKSGSTNADGITIDLGTVNTVAGDLFLTDPNTSVAWTLDALDAIELGGIEENAVATRINGVGVEIAYYELSEATGAISGVGALAGIGEAPAGAPAEATGALASVGALAGIGLAVAQATGALAGVGALAGTGQAVAAATGVLAGVGEFAGTGQAEAAATGALAGVGALAGTGQAESAAIGAVSGVGSLAGAGLAVAAAAGSLAGVGALSGTGFAVAAALGTVTGVGTLAGIGEAPAVTPEATGALTSVGVLAGIGEAIAAAAGTVTGVGTLAGVGFAVHAATGQVLGVGALAGIGEAPALVPEATGALSGVGVLAGVGLAEAAALGTLSAVGTLAGTGLTTRAASGALASVGALVGIGEAPEIAPAEATGAVSGVGALAGTGQALPVARGQLAGVGAWAGIGQALPLGTGTLTAVGALSGVGFRPGAAAGQATGHLSGVGVLGAVGSTRFDRLRFGNSSPLRLRL